ncbi:hypothetical protein Tco_0533748 [Tanacetum coccineum]
MGGIFSIEAKDMDTKLLSAPESNNTRARMLFRRNITLDYIRDLGDNSYPQHVDLPGHCCWWSLGTYLHNALSLHRVHFLHKGWFLVYPLFSVGVTA